LWDQNSVSLEKVPMVWFLTGPMFSHWVRWLLWPDVNHNGNKILPLVPCRICFKLTCYALRTLKRTDCWDGCCQAYKVGHIKCFVPASMNDFVVKTAFGLNFIIVYSQVCEAIANNLLKTPKQQQHNSCEWVYPNYMQWKFVHWISGVRRWSLEYPKFYSRCLMHAY
jgi:hypothetical protein